MRQFGELVRRAGSAESFVSAVRESLTEPAGSQLAEARKRFASEHTWATRVDVLRQQIDAIQRPLISVIVVTHNNLELTKQCLASLDAMTSYPNYEVMVVDNASSDGTQDFLGQWAHGHADRHVILNAENRGFAAASNQGLAAASGEYSYCSITTRSYRGLARNAGRSPASRSPYRTDQRGQQRIDNEARIDIGYADLDGMQAEARLWTSAHLGQTRSMPSVAFFCVAMSREVIARSARWTRCSASACSRTMTTAGESSRQGEASPALWTSSSTISPPHRSMPWISRAGGSYSSEQADLRGQVGPLAPAVETSRCPALALPVSCCWPSRRGWGPPIRRIDIRGLTLDESRHPYS